MDLQDAIAELAGLGYRLDRIMPADDPTSATLTRDGLSVTLAGPGRAEADGVGRAGMEYRDLIPDRLGGAVIASHIRIPDGGPVPDSVHFHDIGFQVIVCRAGWVRVVYEDQGPPFVLSAGDVVLQPPGIRHRVLDASPGLEVVELASPAAHPTMIDHDLSLPTPGEPRPDRVYGAGQRFVRSIAADTPWEPSEIAGWEGRDTRVTEATSGLATVRHLRPTGDPVEPWTPDAQVTFVYVTRGSVAVAADVLAEDDSAVLSPATAHTLTPLRPGATPTELLAITLH